MFLKREQRGDFTTDKSGFYAHPHVVSRDGVHKGGGEFSKKCREAGTQGFVDDDAVEFPEFLTQLAELGVGEMMQNEIGDESPAGLSQGHFKKIALMPSDRFGKSARFGREIVGMDLELRMFRMDFAKQGPIASAELADGSGFRIEIPQDPDIVSHEEIDAPQIVAGSARTRVVVREMVEEFGSEFAHGGRFEENETSHSLQNHGFVG